MDAADLHLVLAPEVRPRRVCRSGNEAIVREVDGGRCGDCIEVWRFNAVTHDTESSAPVVDATACEGCGVCVHVCPRRAIDFAERTCGEWFIPDTRSGPMVHARLGIAAENSGKLVSTVRAAALEIASERALRLILVDGPPGVGCPVISSISGATAVLVVTEPSISGAHDLKRVLSLAHHFGVPAKVCVNRWNLDFETTRNIEEQTRGSGAEVVGRIRYDPTVTRAQVQGQGRGRVGGACGKRHPCSLTTGGQVQCVGPLSGLHSPARRTQERENEVM